MLRAGYRIFRLIILHVYSVIRQTACKLTQVLDLLILTQLSCKSAWNLDNEPNPHYRATFASKSQQQFNYNMWILQDCGDHLACTNSKQMQDPLRLCNLQ